ncbi:hypothetical protein GCM10023320_60840 [Pseudonocardia adelaidensis]|uniref:Uncharacterized protein n=2 Tax=Pseudonocardia adelaidensis TaxID=648754 RepID=A0ABP9NWJ1_9PSEU
MADGAAMWIPLGLAAVPGILAFVVAILNNQAQKRSAQQLEELRHRLADEGRQRALVQRYREPLARAAYDLQSRLWNILRGSFLDPSDPKGRHWLYARDSTVWLFAQYFGWVEIVRREIQFVPAGEDDPNPKLEAVIGKVAHVCSTDSFGSGLFQVLRSEQRALGELVIVEGHDAEGRTRTSCMGFAAFRAALDDPSSEISSWFSYLQEDATSVARTGIMCGRLRHLQHALIDLVDILDPREVRFPTDRKKVRD